MLFVDLHCDTLTVSHDRGRGLLNGEFSVSLERLPPDWQWCQCFGVFIPDQYSGQSAFQEFLRHSRFFRAQMNTHLAKVQMVRTTKDIQSAFAAQRVAAMLTIENGGALGGDLKNIKEAVRAGVRILTLTWNGENDLAGGSETDVGLSFFGRMAIGALEQNGVIIDVSHSSTKTFWDVDKCAKRPYIATHSNAYGVNPHPRNLSDRQFEAIVERGGIVGLTFHVPFIQAGAEKGDDCTFDAFCAHIDHFLSLGGENHLAIGTDFDGGNMPSWLQGVEDIPKVSQWLTARYGETFTAKLMGENAMAFFRRYEALEALLSALGR